MGSNAIAGDQINQTGMTVLTDEDRLLLEGVDKALDDGLALKRWWEETDETNGYAERFELVREFNPAGTSFSFFDQAQLDGRTLPVMGTVEYMLYDQPKSTPGENLRDEFREFILRYFMRVSSYQMPGAFIEAGQTKHGDVRPILQPFSWCPESEPARSGFGYTQLYYKLRDSGEIGKFSQRDECAIVDLREIGQKYEWIVIKVCVFGFSLTFSPFGPGLFSVVFPQEEATYLVISPEFITNQDNPTPGLLGRYGFGYAFLRHGGERGIFAHSQDIFATGFQLINFEMDSSGESRARLVLIANRPDRVLSIEIDPIKWSFRLADLFSLGLASRLLSPVKRILEQFSLGIGNFDPVMTYLSFADAATAGLSAERLCIAMDTMQKTMLLQHYMQHYEMIVGSITTWRHTRNWLDPANLPNEAILGVRP